MKNIIFILILSSFTTVLSQSKYLIYFKDKGKLTQQSLSKMTDKYELASKSLSKRSIERRKKTNGDNFFTYEDLPIEKSYLAELSKAGIKIKNRLKWFNAVSAYLSDSQIELLKTFPFVDKIERVRTFKSEQADKNEDFNPTRLLNKTGSIHVLDYGASLTQNQLSDIPQVHDMGITGEGVIIGLLDSGFDWKTPVSLSGRKVLAEYDFIFNDTVTANDKNDVTSSQHNHGTSVFSILAGFDEGNLIGPAFNSQFLLAKTEFIPTETHAEEDNYAAALEWMDSIGVDITSSSLGYSEFDATEFSYTYDDMDGKTTIVTKAAELAFDRGILIMTSAGNEGNTSWHFITAPGDGFNTLTIGAVTSSNLVTSFSSRGPTADGRIKPEIVAMGSGVVNAIATTTNGYGTGSGTSFSAPISAGIASLLLSAHPHLTNKQIRSILMESGDNVENPDNDRGYGLISALRAVTYPNLQQSGSKYILHKVFDPSLNIDENTVELVFDDGNRFPMTKNGFVFKVELPVLTSGVTHQIYFSFKNLQGNQLREPSSSSFTLKQGQLNIDHFLTDIVSTELIPNKVVLFQNYPNPFNPSTTINYSIPDRVDTKFASTTNVTLKVFNILGQEVTTLVNKSQQPGNYSVEFSSAQLTSGIYFYQLSVGDFTKTKKMTVLK